MLEGVILHICRGIKGVYFISSSLLPPPPSGPPTLSYYIFVIFMPSNNPKFTHYQPKEEIK